MRIDNDAHSVPLTDVIERLLNDFGSQLARSVVAAVVQRCRTELDIVARPALPELVERLARQRLDDMITTRSNFISATK